MSKENLASIKAKVVIKSADGGEFENNWTANTKHNEKPTEALLAIIDYLGFVAQRSAVAPRVTKEQIDALMDQVKVHTVMYLEPTPHVLAIAWLYGKFHLGTAISKAVDPKNFSEELGIKYATEDVLELAENKLWEFEGYRLFQIM